MSQAEHEFRSRCSIARSLEILGDKCTFQELQTSEERMPTNQLSQRLKRLMEWGLVEREAYQDKPVRYHYRVTSAGRELEPILLQLMSWGHAHLGGGLYDPSSGETVAEASGR